jgi:HEAT repeat protein
MPKVLVVAALILLAAPARPQESEFERKTEAFQALRAELRQLQRTSKITSVHTNDQLRIIKEIAELETAMAIQHLVELVRDPKYFRVHNEILNLLAKHAPDSVIVASLFKEHMGLSDPNRSLARGYLLRRAVRRRDEDWLRSLYNHGTIEDSFLALKSMGLIRADGTLDAARRLANDPDWKPRPGTAVTCGSIATSLKHVEGSDAARLLLLLRQDPRFTERDGEDLREATRLWARRDLRDYVGIGELADPDPARRAESAAFMGAAGFEEARAPLLRLARDGSQPDEVRAQAAEALGRLRIARAAMARTLAELARDERGDVARGAVRGLAHLGVRAAAAELVKLLEGPQATEARGALAKLTGAAADTDWAAWVAGPECNLPEGT